jgi:thiol-disulfide isomerase/thioredoxin
MRTSFFLVVLSTALSLASIRAHAQSTAVSPASELKALTAAVRTKVQAGKTSAVDLAPELAAYDALVARYAGNKSDEVAQILFQKEAVYSKILKDAAGAKAVQDRIKAEFPGTKSAAFFSAGAGGGGSPPISADKAALVGKQAPELHFAWASIKDLKTLSSLKGKVVVIDFWATWCGPCISSFPKVRDLVEHYKGSDVVVLGVTSLQGRVSNLGGAPVDTQGQPDKEYALMPEFMQFKEMTWPVVFSEEKVFNPDYSVTGIPHVTIIAPDGTVRHNGLHPGSSLESKTELIDAILKEFKRPIPVAKKA